MSDPVARAVIVWLEGQCPGMDPIRAFQSLGKVEQLKLQEFIRFVSLCPDVTQAAMPRDDQDAGHAQAAAPARIRKQTASRTAPAVQLSALSLH